VQAANKEENFVCTSVQTICSSYNGTTLVQQALARNLHDPLLCSAVVQRPSLHDHRMEPAPFEPAGMQENASRTKLLVVIWVISKPDSSTSLRTVNSSVTWCDRVLFKRGQHASSLFCPGPTFNEARSLTKGSLGGHSELLVWAIWYGSASMRNILNRDGLFSRT
jgi:hypothetical protein